MKPKTKLSVVNLTPALHFHEPEALLMYFKSPALLHTELTLLVCNHKGKCYLIDSFHP